MEFTNPKETTEFYDYLTQEKRLGVRTVAVYMSYYSSFDSSSIGQEQIIKYARKHKNTSACRGFLMNYINFKHLDLKLPDKPKGRKPIRLPREISPNELELLRKFFYSKGFKKGLIFELIYQGALRRVEIVSIKLNSFKWDRWFEDISKFCHLIILGKGNKEREVLINPETAYKIANYYMEQNDVVIPEDLRNILNTDRLLFVDSQGEALNEQSIYSFIKRGSREALKTRDVRPHELRHSRSSELEEKGVPIRDIQRYLGHSKIATTELYLHRSNEKAIDSVENHLS